MKPIFVAAVAIAASLSSLSAATFVVPVDRDLIHRADAIVLASPLSSYTQLSDAGGVETVTVMSVTEVVHGDVPDVVDVVEPGGTYRDVSTLIAGVPQFAPGDKLMLFLRRTGADRWAVEDLVLGKFRFATDNRGRELLVRDAEEIAAWDTKLRPYREPVRAAAPFRRFVGNEARGIRDVEDYLVTDPAPLRVQANAAVAPTATFTATSYSMTISGSLGSRWAQFPSGVTMYAGAAGEPGAPGNGTTAVQTAIASWDNDCLSNVNYVYGGTDSTHTAGLSGTDGANTVLFERNLSAYGVTPFSCGSGGTLGLGGITSASGSNTVNGETFVSTQEADVEMNQGIANCTSLFNSGDFNTAVTHEVGHTLGFRHADQNRASTGACSTDASLECSSQAVMKSFISTGINAALQAWDQHAVQAVYPGNVCAPGPACTAPAITSNPSSQTIVTGQTTRLTVGATGTAPLSYQWYVGTSGNIGSPIQGATNASIDVSPSTTTSYWVRVSNSCGSADSTTAVVTVTVNTPSAASKFFPVTPCRLIDTRNPNGPSGGPALPSGSTRTIAVAGACGIPTAAVAVAVNLTVVNPGAIGYMTLYAGNSSQPLASTINYSPGRTLANNGIVRVGSDSINVFNSGSTINFIIDVNGYFK